NEQPLALIAEDGQHVIREVADDDARIARSVNVREISTHPAARLPFLAEGHAGRQSRFGERPFAAVVFIKLVRLRVVGDEDVGPTVTVVIDDRHPKRFARRVEESGFFTPVAELPAYVVIEPRTLALVFLRRAVALVDVVERAEDVGLRRPFDVVAEEEVEPPVLVIIEEGRR